MGRVQSTSGWTQSEDISLELINQEARVLDNWQEIDGMVLMMIFMSLLFLIL